MTPQGRFLFNLPNPTWDFILKCERSSGREFEERGHYSLEDGQGTLLVEQAQAVNTLEQTITTTLHFTRFDAQGNEIESGQSQWRSRYLFYYEAVLPLQRCSFEIEALVGDYHNGPITEQGQPIFQVRPGEKVGSE